ncbi:MAG: 50S ribosomal protein L3 [Candidatus Binatia bacterium]|nr:MAG: 50S ribosomal protein L3 [Candidatus Binatia bacterium]
MTGLIGQKIGMTQIFDTKGGIIPVTVLKVGPCTVVQVKTEGTDGYAAIQLGWGIRKPSRVSKAYRAHCEKAGGRVFRVLREFVPRAGREYAVGQEIRVGDLFTAGQYVDVTGISKGRGFAGVMKRHGFGGFPGSHGTHEYFRHGGSIGNRSFPGRVFKGKRMAGHYGAERVTVQNLAVIAVYPEDDVMLVKGAVPGPNGGIVLVRHAVKKQEVASVELA